MQNKEKIVVVVRGETKKQRNEVIDFMKRSLAKKKAKVEFEHVYQAV